MNQIYTKIFIDAEWNSKNHYISLQIRYQNRNFIYLDTYYYTKYPLLIKEWEKEKKNTQIISWNFQSHSNELIIDQILEQNDSWTHVEMVFYYSYMDLYALFSEAWIQNLFSDKNKNASKISYMSKTQGNFAYKDVFFTLTDLYGWNKTGGLSKLQNIVNYQNSLKSTISSGEKAHLEIYLEKPENMKTFLDYGIDDVESLEFIQKNMLKKLNQLYTEVYQFPRPFLLTPKSLPGTFGSIGSSLVERFIFHQMSLVNGEFDRNEFMRFDKINTKLGIATKEDSPEYNLEKRLTLNKKGEPKSTMLNACSIRSIGENYNLSSGLENAIVQGGRSNNERPNKYVFETVADIDIVSCYGGSLVQFDYPLGLPFIHAVTKGEKKLTLKAFLEKYRSELVPNLYTITISKKLSFSQDLLFSKMVKNEDLKRKIFLQKYKLKETNSPVSESDLVLFRNELKNSILTSDILEGLEKICSSNEWKEILESEVVTGCFYRKSDYLEPKEFVNYFDQEKNFGSYVYNSETQSVEDNRSRKWTKLPLSNLIQPLLDKRSFLKQKKKESTIEADKIKFSNEEQFYKLFVNLISGLLGSYYFNISNTVLYNNITARARFNIWLISKPLRGIQTITDGCAYSVCDILELRDGKKPGLNTLSKLSHFETLKDKNILQKLKKGTLGDKKKEEWAEIYSSNNLEELKKLDTWALEKINKFWSPYNILLQYQIEHKLENCSHHSFNVMKCHYALGTIHEEEMLFKFRGMSVLIESMYKKLSSIFTLNENPWVTLEEFIQLTTHRETHLQTIHEYLEEIKLGKPTVLPGKVKSSQKTFRVKASDLPFENSAQYKLIEKEDIDFAAIMIDKIKKQNYPMVNLANFFEDIMCLKWSYFEEKKRI